MFLICRQEYDQNLEVRPSQEPPKQNVLAYLNICIRVDETTLKNSPVGRFGRSSRLWVRKKDDTVSWGYALVRHKDANTLTVAVISFLI